VRTALRLDADAICEKPLVLNPWNLDALEEMERETGRKVSTVLQLRVHPSLVELKRKLDLGPAGRRPQVVLTYVTSRGVWYRYSWKGEIEKSGGLATNIGIHFFDLLMWLFGKSRREEVTLLEAGRASGVLDLERADVLWYLSTERADLPFEAVPGKKTTFRSITIDGEEIEFSEGFTDLHTKVYEETLAGRGFGIQEARPSVELAYRIRHATAVPSPSAIHPLQARSRES
jgi:UDP-N-acetyl-2-amino-2-deoxyglucuronate dehydrogenase